MIHQGFASPSPPCAIPVPCVAIHSLAQGRHWCYHGANAPPDLFEGRPLQYFVVTRERGPAWDSSRSMREQERWAEHAAFMDALAEEGFVLLGGPLGEGLRFLLIIDTDSEEAIATRFAADPWTPMGMLRIAKIERWQILLGDAEKS
jgi:hypothetical protein